MSYYLSPKIRALIDNAKSDVRSLIALIVLLLSFFTYVTWKQEDEIRKYQIENQKLLIELGHYKEYEPITK